MESSRLILRDIAAMAYLEESELVRMAGTMAKFLGRPDLREDLKSPAVMRDIRRELLGYLESIADGDAKVMEVRRVLRPDSSGRLDELAVEGDTFPAMVTDALSRHLRGIYPEQIRRCSQCDHVIVTARRPKTGVGGTYCNQACFDRALNARKKVCR